MPTTSGTATALGRVQMGEVEQEIMVNMLEDWGLRHALEECIVHREPAGVGPEGSDANCTPMRWARAACAKQYLIAPASRGRRDLFCMLFMLG